MIEKMRIVMSGLLLCFTTFYGISQPPICGNTPAMTSYCANACIICDIDGFTGRNNSNVTGQAPPGFCTSFVHHMQWIGFIAGSTNLTLEVKVSNCQRNEGLEIGLYQSLDCTTFKKISDCDTDIQPGRTRVFTNTVPLIIGQYYYFVMDGSDNDICDWSIKVTNGTTKVLPLTIAPEIIIPDQVCQMDTVALITPGLTGATFYTWTIDGDKIKSGTNTTYAFTKPGVYNVSLDASNVCDKAPQSCKTIEVLPTPEGYKSQEICYGECFTFYDKKYCTSGRYEVRLPSSNGCDSIIIFDLVVDDRIMASVSLNICLGDTLTIGDGKFFSEGIHQAIIKNQEGCNIYITLTLKTIFCNITSKTESIPVLCNGGNTGIIRFAVDQGSPPFTFTGIKIENPSVTFSGNIGDVGEYAVITGVDEGNYQFTIEDTYGNSRVIYIFVSQPMLLSAGKETSDYHQYNVSCYGASDGFLKLIPAGGVAPYTFAHQGRLSVTDTLRDLSAGVYVSTITDANGCTFEMITNMQEPDTLMMLLQKKDPDCSSYTSGYLDISASKGGVKPYEFWYDNNNKQTSGLFTNLAGGRYQLNIRDQNGCIQKMSASLKDIDLVSLDIYENELTVALGDSISLLVLSNLSQESVSWFPDDVIGCKDCLSTKALPVNDTDFEIRVTSKDGCTQNATIRVKVDKKRSFVMANIFTPDKSGQNDDIRYFAGKDVASINEMRIYDRWGNVVYQSSGLPTGLADIDWKGNMQGRELQNGVYTWICRVTYLDDVSLTYSGNITLVR